MREAILILQFSYIHLISPTGQYVDTYLFVIFLLSVRDFSRVPAGLPFPAAHERFCSMHVERVQVTIHGVLGCVSPFGLNKHSHPLLFSLKLGLGQTQTDWQGQLS